MAGSTAQRHTKGSRRPKTCNPVWLRAFTLWMRTASARSTGREGFRPQEDSPWWSGCMAVVELGEALDRLRKAASKANF